jgi:glutamine synthetase
MEFSLFAGASEDAEPYDDASSYEIVPVDRSRSLIRQWITAMRTAGFDIIAIHKESQPGQYEVVLRHDDAVRAADAVMFFRYMIRSVSLSSDVTASFMPRPHSNEDSNGMHFHISLWDQCQENNQFAGTDQYLDFPAGQQPSDAGLSDDASHFVGGILDHTKGLTAVCAPTINSYKRLLPGHFAPVNIAWGPDNRTTSIRIPPELGSSARIEYRIPDSSSNPYLAMAATLGAGLNGLLNGVEPNEPVTTNAYETDLDQLPRTLIAALDELQSDQVLVDVLGEELVSEFTKIKRDEFNRYQDHISDWERSQYDNAF